MDGDVPEETAVLMASTEKGIADRQLLDLLGAISPSDLKAMMSGKSSSLRLVGRELEKRLKKGTPIFSATWSKYFSRKRYGEDPPPRAYEMVGQKVAQDLGDCLCGQAAMMVGTTGASRMDWAGRARVDGRGCGRGDGDAVGAFWRHGALSGERLRWVRFGWTGAPTETP